MSPHKFHVLRRLLDHSDAMPIRGFICWVQELNVLSADWPWLEVCLWRCELERCALVLDSFLLSLLLPGSLKLSTFSSAVTFCHPVCISEEKAIDYDHGQKPWDKCCGCLVFCPSQWKWLSSVYFSLSLPFPGLICHFIWFHFVTFLSKWIIYNSWNLWLLQGLQYKFQAI